MRRSFDRTARTTEGSEAARVAEMEGEPCGEGKREREGAQHLRGPSMTGTACVIEEPSLSPILV